MTIFRVIKKPVRTTLRLLSICVLTCGLLAATAEVLAAKTPRRRGTRTKKRLAKQKRIVRKAWIDFANDYYKISLDGGPKIGARNGAKQTVCFEFKAKASKKAAKRLLKRLKKVSAGDRPLFIGADVATKRKLAADTVSQFGRARSVAMGSSGRREKIVGMFDWTSEILGRPPKVVLNLPGLREVVVRTDGEVVLRVPFVVSLRSRGESLMDPEGIFTPNRKCSDFVDRDLLKSNSVVELRVIDLGEALATAEDVPDDS